MIFWYLLYLNHFESFISSVVSQGYLLSVYHVTDNDTVLSTTMSEE